MLFAGKNNTCIDTNCVFQESFMDKKKFQIALACLILALFAALFFKHKTRIYKDRLVSTESGSRQVMGTFARMVVVSKDTSKARTAIKAAFEKIASVEKLMSRYDKTSQLSIVNSEAFDKPIKVDDVLFELLQRSVYYSRISGGAFDITVGPLIILWKKCAEANSPPNKEQMQEVNERIGYEKLILDPENKTVQFANDGMMLDLGAIAKGCAIDRAIETIKKAGVNGAMVDIGGDIACFGKAPGTNGWVIGLQDPAVDYIRRVAMNKILLKLKLSDMAIATSGDYQRYVTIAGKRYSHIINPATSTSADETASVTIIAQNATDADAMATTVSVLGVQKGLELIEKTPGIEAIIIPAEKKSKLIKSSGVDKYILD